MRDSLFGITTNAQIEQANVLDALPDPIIIVGKDHPTYVNEEALKLLNCSADIQEIQAMDDLSQLKCKDKDTELEVTLIERIIQVLTTVDPRLEGLDKELSLRELSTKRPTRHN